MASLQEIIAFFQNKLQPTTESAILLYSAKLKMESLGGKRESLSKVLQLYFRNFDDTRSGLIGKALSYDDEEEQVLHSFTAQIAFEAFTLLELEECLAFLFSDTQQIIATSEHLQSLMSLTKLKSLSEIIKHH